MKILICAGHTLKGKGTGATGYINESQENRSLSNIVVKYLKLAGHTVDYYEINEASDYLQKQVAKANSKDYDLVVQIHFNAHKTTNSEMGTETLYVSESGKVWAEKINNKLSSIFKNRGVKKRTDLYWLNNTKSIACLIEVCFVDSKADTDKYLANKNKVGKLIAEAIHRREIEEVKEASEVFYRVIAGSFSNRENAEQQLKLLNDKGIKGGFLD
ncbi:MAG: N-acetylmuramoyl-L-alanine amidase, partial [Peptostreptococcaceae bacterium]|nr:N-acetylmuramoyl-L-alanine amidase [Peptostreptococcaceae bacterium]